MGLAEIDIVYGWKVFLSATILAGIGIGVECIRAALRRNRPGGGAS